MRAHAQTTASLAAITIVALSGCQKDARPSGGSGAPSASASSKPAPKAPEPTVADFKRTLEALKVCKLTGRYVKHTCKEKLAFARTRRSRSVLAERAQIKKIAIANLSNEAPAVRVASANFLRSFFPSDPQARDGVMKQVPKEKLDGVLVNLLDCVGAAIGKDKRVAEEMLKQADSKSELVRGRAVAWLASQWAKGNDKVVAKIGTMMEKDPSRQVRITACASAYKLESPKILPVYKKLVKDKEVGGACLRGMGEMWASYMLKDRSEAAYKAFFKVLKKKPRSKQSPSFLALNVFNRPNRPLKEKWYDKKEVADLLKDIVLDKDAHWMTRSGAVRGLHNLGWKKKEFEELQKKFKDAKGDDLRVLNNVKRAASGHMMSRPRMIRPGKLRNGTLRFRSRPVIGPRGATKTPGGAKKAHLAPCLLTDVTQAGHPPFLLAGARPALRLGQVEPQASLPSWRWRFGGSATATQCRSAALFQPLAPQPSRRKPRSAQKARGQMLGPG